MTSTLAAGVVGTGGRRAAGPPAGGAPAPRDASPLTGAVQTGRPANGGQRPQPPLTSGRIALANLSAGSSAARAGAGDGRAQGLSGLVDALLIRAQVLRCVADLEEADRVSAAAVSVCPRDGWVRLARARAAGALHRFADADHQLTLAARYGAPTREIAVERACLLQATGRIGVAVDRWQGLLAARPDRTARTGLALARAQIGPLPSAVDLQRLTVDARTVSPIPAANLLHQVAQLARHHGHHAAAHTALVAAERLLPAHVGVQAELAALDAGRGQHAAAAARLRPVVDASDDPAVAGQLGFALRAVGQHAEARVVLAAAHTRFCVLLNRHPEAFAARATEFWLQEGVHPGHAARAARLHAAAQHPAHASPVSGPGAR